VRLAACFRAQRRFHFDMEPTHGPLQSHGGEKAPPLLGRDGEPRSVSCAPRCRPERADLLPSLRGCLFAL
jgi:hypothetical protein